MYAYVYIYNYIYICVCVPIISLIFYTLEAQVASSTYQNPTDGELPLLQRSNFFWHKSQEANSFESLLSWNSSNGKWSSCVVFCMSLLCSCSFRNLEFQGVRSAYHSAFHWWVVHVISLISFHFRFCSSSFSLGAQQAVRFSVELCKAWHQHNNKNTITRPSLQKPLGHFLLLLAGKWPS